MDGDEFLNSLIGLFDEEQNVQAGRTQVSLDMWGSCTPRNIGKKMRRTSCLKPLHRELMRQFIDICVKAGVESFVYGGTALGVFREGGHMIAFDYDNDFATLEYPSGACGNGSLSQLANFCVRENSGVNVVNIDCLRHDSPLNATIQVDFQDVFASTSWFYLDQEKCIRERPYTGVGSKRAKFSFTPYGIREAIRNAELMKPALAEELAKDLTSIHIDLFTLSPHPESPEHHLRVNWHKSGVYDSLNKKFLKSHFFPLQEVTFEGFKVLAPCNLEGYLTEEYGYLDRDAMYDSSRQCYIKIPDNLRALLPRSFERYLLKFSCKT
ncbi:unnamed protein product [Mesocestoides corti]|uniref:LicD/FKTN/FKRP nucleotidyltransferase domain-containing protein n=1 Tax=Mesocestoides corti TaxID=53468 RepID=A0A0R3UFC9_MESCO|nr:unnamed protein product [Mesocestoides corti]